jgi:hypothetical protein
MDDHKSDNTQEELPIKAGLVLLVRVWIDGVSGAKQSLRGHISILGGEQQSPFNSLTQMLVRIEALIRTKLKFKRSSEEK